jgi:hypothetical protein
VPSAHGSCDLPEALGQWHHQRQTHQVHWSAFALIGDDFMPIVQLKAPATDKISIGLVANKNKHSIQPQFSLFVGKKVLDLYTHSSFCSPYKEWLMRELHHDLSILGCLRSLFNGMSKGLKMVQHM